MKKILKINEEILINLESVSVIRYYDGGISSIDFHFNSGSIYDDCRLEIYGKHLGLQNDEQLFKVHKWIRETILQYAFLGTKSYIIDTAKGVEEILLKEEINENDGPKHVEKLIMEGV